MIDRNTSEDSPPLSAEKIRAALNRAAEEAIANPTKQAAVVKYRRDNPNSFVDLSSTPIEDVRQVVAKDPLVELWRE